MSELYLSQIHFFNPTQSVDQYMPLMMSKDKVLEINFHSELNSLCMFGDITLIDTNNNLLDCINEPDIQCVVEIMKCAQSGDDNIKPIGIFLRYAFIVSQIDVLKFSADTSTLKIYLEDTIQNLAMDKLIRYSNFDIPYKDINVQDDLWKILNPLEIVNTNKLVIPENVFGESTKNYRRRFTSARDETVQEAMIHYIENLYEKSYDESILTPEFDKDRKIPDRLVAFAPHFQIAYDGGPVKLVPRLTTAVEIVANESVDTPMTEFKFAQKQIRGVIEGMDPMCVKIAFSQINKYRDFKDLTPLNYVTNWLNRKTGNHDYDLWNKQPGDSPILSNGFKNIESEQNNKYPGIGVKPKFKINPFFRVKSVAERYAFTTDYRFYGDNSERSIYQDLSEILIRPYVYVTCPFSAMHSPGQVVDLTYARFHQEGIETKLNHTYNKLFSGKWKVIRTTTKFSNNKIQNSVGMAFEETLGLNRLGYFSEDIVHSGRSKEGI